MAYSLKWEIGANTAFAGKICDTLWTSINYGMYAVQFCMGGMQRYNRSVISPIDIKECKKILARFPLHVFSHFPYVANLAGSKKCLAWNGDSKQDAIMHKVISSLEYELGVISNLSLGEKKSGVVIHPGNYPDKKKGITAIAKTINKLTFPPSSKLLLENSAGAGTSLATTLQEIKDIIDQVDEKRKEHIGVCIDTCHLYAYGEYDLSKVDEVKRFFTDFDTIVGSEWFTLLHLNDSKVELGEKKDRHACICTGYIWGKSYDSLVYLLDECKKRNIPIVLETHGLDMITLSVIQAQIQQEDQ